MKKHLWVSLLAFAGIFAACESLNGPQAVDDSSALEESFEISALESETGILKSAGVNADEANAFFVLRWRVPPQRVESDAAVKGHASAVAYEEPTTLRDRNALGLDMGTVAVLIGQDKFELPKLESTLFGVRYGMFGKPHGGKRGPHGGMKDPKGGLGGPRGGSRGGLGGPNGDKPVIVNIPFVAGGAYQFDVSGSDKIAAMKLAVQAPAALVKITGLTDKQEIDATQDLTVTWEGDANANNMVLVLAPAMKRGRFGGQPVQPVFQSVDAAAGSYTIAAQTLQDVVSQSNARALSVHLAQGNMNEINDTNLGRILVSAGTDDRVLLIVK
ncbi:MAG: hypothetical protein ONB46_01815 [candidate division KSB1 bacterium]|nr:hypothetical protein [candidate division KSB1 bacterium]MDZ7364404.1 hypothetical protein [candidate division KSB1 bacterium]MDZ7402776.1 hypothetical protein [candidate division KSB1 bacterium]